MEAMFCELHILYGNFYKYFALFFVDRNVLFVFNHAIYLLL